MVDLFIEHTGIRPIDWILEGNGSSDKKVSTYSTSRGRGVNVTAECFLSEKVLNEVLRTSSHKMMQAFAPSCKLALMDGMVGYNINVANAVAAIFVATGQDLACIHESSVGILQLKEMEDGLRLRLNLPNLVIGTVGGGTHLRKQSEGLHILKCAGVGKVNRFAKLIAGFAMGLEISTYAAIVSGEFAKAHEKLGRNKPADWLLPNELNASFLKRCLNHFQEPVLSIQLHENEKLENGILTHIAKRVSKKVLGFKSLVLQSQNGQEETVESKLLLKSKALDDEVIKGLHAIAASIDPGLSDLIKTYRHVLEYEKCHVKEIEMYAYLNKHKFEHMPKFYGEYTDVKREIYLLVMEELDVNQLRLFNAENTPEKWSPAVIKEVIQKATTFHALYEEQDERTHCNREFKPWEANELYNKLVSLLVAEEKNPTRKIALEQMVDAALHLQQLKEQITVPKTIIHNDFNPRNIAVRHSGEILIYDWELAVKNYPHRDIMEWLSFTLKEDFTKAELMIYLEEHYQLSGFENRSSWFLAYEYAITEFIITRALFYEVAGIVVKYDFSARVLNNAFKILNMLKNND
jgi:hydroxymethylglutaryl-CoA reductase (NADPH)